MLATNMILAADSYGRIGYNNDLPWAKIKRDLKWFSEHTTDNVVVMGSNTWKSLGKIAPLKNRINYVITSKSMDEFTGAHDLYDHTEYSLENIAIPNDKNIEVYNSKPGYYAAITYGGYSNSEKVKKNHSSLLNKLQAENFKILNSQPVVLSYNSPYKVFNRRNEVLVEVEF